MKQIRNKCNKAELSSSLTQDVTCQVGNSGRVLFCTHSYLDGCSLCPCSNIFRIQAWACSHIHHPHWFLSWDDTEWTLLSEAKKVEVNRNLDGPCWRESKFTIFTMEANHWQRDCTNLIWFHDVMIAKMKMRCVNMKTVFRKEHLGQFDKEVNYVGEVELV